MSTWRRTFTNRHTDCKCCFGHMQIFAVCNAIWGKVKLGWFYFSNFCPANSNMTTTLAFENRQIKLFYIFAMHWSFWKIPQSFLISQRDFHMSTQIFFRLRGFCLLLPFKTVSYSIFRTKSKSFALSTLLAVGWLVINHTDIYVTTVWYYSFEMPSHFWLNRNRTIWINWYTKIAVFIWLEFFNIDTDTIFRYSLNVCHTWTHRPVDTAKCHNVQLQCRFQHKNGCVQCTTLMFIFDALRSNCSHSTPLNLTYFQMHSSLFSFEQAEFFGDFSRIWKKNRGSKHCFYEHRLTSTITLIQIIN